MFLVNVTIQTCQIVRVLNVPFCFDVTCFVHSDCVAIRSVLAYSSQHKRFLLGSVFNYFRRIRHWMPFPGIVRTSQSSNDDNDENCGIFV